MNEAPEALPAKPEVVARLVSAHRDFLRFLEARLPDRATAEEVLQTAFTRALERGGAIRDDESAVAWFYRLLRNALTDYHRRQAAQSRALDRLAAQPVHEELHTTVCACIKSLLPNLKDEYADVLARADLAGVPVAQVAADLNITANNATVRLHRARQALKRELERSCGTCAAHGCLDCSCAEAPGHCG